MHPRITELVNHLETQHDALRRAVERVPAALRDQRPAPDAWSVAEVLEHLALVEGNIARNVAAKAVVAREAGAGPDPDTASVLPGLDMTQAADRGIRRESPTRVAPTGTVDAAAAANALAAAQRALHDALHAGADVNLGAITMPHGLFGEMSLYHWAAFAAAHERRHTEQVDEIGARLKVVSHGAPAT